MARRLGPAGLPGPWRARGPPRPALPGSNEAMGPSFAEVPAAAARRTGRGRGGRPRRSDSDAARSDASARFPGSAEERRFGSDGPRAWGAADRRSCAKQGVAGRGAARSSSLRAAFSDASAAQSVASERLRDAEGAQGRISRAFCMGSGRAFESCPIRQAYRTSPHHDKRGG